MDKREEKELKKIERGLHRLGRRAWYQRWWGVLLMGFFASALVAMFEVLASFVISFFG